MDRFDDENTAVVVEYYNALFETCSMQEDEKLRGTSLRKEVQKWEKIETGKGGKRW